MHGEAEKQHPQGDQGDPTEAAQAMGRPGGEERPHRQAPRYFRQVRSRQQLGYEA